MSDTKKIAVKIANPAVIAGKFGECAGDYKPAECQYWVGTKDELWPQSTPGDAEIVEAKVKFCGGGAWVAD